MNQSFGGRREKRECRKGAGSSSGLMGEEDDAMLERAGKLDPKDEGQGRRWVVKAGDWGGG